MTVEQQQGHGVTLSDGKEWILPTAITAAALTEIRDRLYDEIAYSGSVPVLEIKAAAWILLRSHHGLSQEQAAELLALPETRELTQAVCQALIDGPPTRTYTNWVRSALLANGLDPTRIPANDVPHVLAQLVATGRAAPADEFVTSAAYERKRARLLAAAD